MTHICKNCGNKFEGNFCNNCGAPAEIHPINTHFLIHDIQHGLFHVDGGIFYSARELLKRPGHTIREYIEGKRLKHYKPISMVIVLASFYGLLYHFFDVNVFKGKDDELFNYEDINEWIAHHFSIITLLLLPVLSLSSYIVFKRQGYNFTEHLVLNAFYSSQKLWVRILTMPLIILTEKPLLIMNWLMVVDLLLMVWCYTQFFKKIKTYKVLLLTIITTVLNLLITVLLTSIVLAILLNK